MTKAVWGSVPIEMKRPATSREDAAPVLMLRRASDSTLLGPFDAFGDGVQEDADLAVGRDPLLVDLLAAEPVPAMDEGQRPGELRQEEGFLQGVIAAADDGDVAPGEESPVADRRNRIRRCPSAAPRRGRPTAGKPSPWPR